MSPRFWIVEMHSTMYFFENWTTELPTTAGRIVVKTFGASYQDKQHRKTVDFIIMLGYCV